MITPRKLLVWAGLAVSLTVLAVQIAHVGSDSALLPSPDFAMFWAAGRLNAHGENPYEPEALYPLQREANPSQPFPVIMYSPPLALTLAMPFGLLESHVSRLLWLLTHFAVIILSADWAWSLYGGPARYRGLAWVLAVGFVPTLLMLRIGQAVSLVLLGVVGFLRFQQRGRDGLAGALLALALIKLHLVYLLLLAVGLWVVAERRWAVLLGAGLVGGAATAVPLATNLQVIGQYRAAVATHSPLDWDTPTAGTLLRVAFGAHRYWLQFLPAVPGLLWLAFSWLRNRATWDWARQAPALVLVSLLTACYGAWSFDYVVALLPVIQVAARTARDPARGVGWPLAVFLALDVAMALQSYGFFLGVENELWFCWVPLALCVCYVSLGRLSRPPRAPALAAE